MGDQSQDFESQKLQLEKDKLAFEIRKFDEDQTKREREAAKLEEEIRELRRPWYQKPSYLGPLATFTVAIIGGTIAFGTDVFKSNVFGLRNERNQLSRSVHDLNSDKTRLSADNAKLRGAKDLLTSNINALSDKAANLSRDNQRLELAMRATQREKEALSRDILLTELKTHLKIIRSLGPHDHLERSNQSLQNLLVIAEQSGNNPDTIAVLESAYNDSGSSLEVKAALCLALFKATKRSEWKTCVRQLALDQVATQLRSSSVLDGLKRESIYLALLAEGSVFTLSEKVETLRAMYAIARTQTAPFGGQVFGFLYEDPLYLITWWNEDATLAFRDPWFDYLGRLYDRREWESSYYITDIIGFGPRLLAFAPQAFGILLLKSLSDSTVLLSVDRTIPTGISGGNTECPYFPASFPLCRDWAQPRKREEVVGSSLVRGRSVISSSASTYSLTTEFSIRSSSIPAYREWVSDNQELVAVWTDRTFSALRNCSDNVMRRILRGGWIEISDLKAPP
jgi:hypothetical protein